MKDPADQGRTQEMEFDEPEGSEPEGSEPEGSEPEGSEPEGGILPADVAQDLRDAFPTKPKRVVVKQTLTEVRAGNRLRKRAQRKRQKFGTAGVAEQDEVENFWLRNRSAANQGHIAELLEREAAVFHIQFEMQWYEAGTYEANVLLRDRIPLNALVAEVEEEARQGTVNVECTLLEFWKHPNIYTQLVNMGGPTKDFVRYGIFTGISSQRLHRWNTWLASKKALSNPSDNGYTTLQCVNYMTCRALPDAVEREIADGYQRLGKPFLCHNCRSVESQSRSQAWPQIKRAAPRVVDEDTIFDNFGRIKT